MADLGTSRGVVAAEPPDQRPTAQRTVRRRRGLPRGRAVVGALLVTASAVAVFAAYLDAQREPGTSYLVASDTLEPGTRFTDRADLIAAVSAAPLALQPELAERAIPIEQLDDIVGWQVVAPLERGELLTRSAVVPDGDLADAQTMSFALPRSAAVGGALRAGERIDVVATYGSGDAAVTAYVVRGLPLLHVSASDGGTLGSGGDVSLTVGVDDPTDVLALGHAINLATVFVTRSTGDADGAAALEPYTGADRPGAGDGEAGRS